jgi:peptidoglycan/LPS O-acetylase OafA/YrhL
LSLLTGAPVICLIVKRGPAWTVNHYFWIDLAVVPSMALLIIAVAIGQPRILRRLLDSGPVRTLGSFSYSLYLIHLPIVMVISRKVARPYIGNGVPAFLTTFLIGAPLSILCAWLFAKAFEAPFRQNRSWRELIATPRFRGMAASRRPQAPRRQFPCPLPQRSHHQRMESEKRQRHGAPGHNQQTL